MFDTSIRPLAEDSSYSIEVARPRTHDSVADKLQRAMTQSFPKFPPLWPLKNFVAVNPFLGFQDRTFLESAQWLRSTAEIDILLPREFYLNHYRSGRIQEFDLKEAMALCGLDWEERGSLFNATAEISLNPPRHPASERIHEQIQVEISKFCASYFDEGQSLWQMPWRDLSLYEAWKNYAEIDRTPEIKGIPGFRKFVAHLPSDPMATASQLLPKLEPDPEKWEAYIYQSLTLVAGWMSYLQFRAREKLDRRFLGRNFLVDLLAIRLSYELALPKELRTSKNHHKENNDSLQKDLFSRYVWQTAFDLGFRRELLEKLALKKATTQSPDKSARKTVQAIFCIDVRSEVFRRHMESLSNQVETLGFAGFFGFPIKYFPLGEKEGKKQCPVLLEPRFTVSQAFAPQFHYGQAASLAQLQQKNNRKRAWKTFKASAVSCFSFVESMGIGFGFKLLKDTFKLTPPLNSLETGGTIALDLEGDERGFTLADQVALAAGALKNMSLTSHFAKIVLLCGHGSSTQNNPYGSGLDCGACGGHSGEVNAQVAAKVLNRPVVRHSLAQMGILIPSDTWFIAGLHNTTTDEVTLFGDDLPRTHLQDFEDLKSLLQITSSRARVERAKKLVLAEQDSLDMDLEPKLRSRDWSEVRPEWGLAGNAAFIIADRKLTQGLNLEGRVFLHSYRSHEDSDGKRLELIMTAPMVVANWINLQYFASSANNVTFGSGDKVTHNVVGRFGIIQGNGSDLKVGLPFQSVHDGKGLVHEPIRLQVVIEAPLDRISKIINEHEQVRQLVNHRWLNILACPPDGDTFYDFTAQGWKRVRLA